MAWTQETVMKAVADSVPGSEASYRSLFWLGMHWRIEVTNRGWYVDGRMIHARRNTQAAVAEVVSRVINTLETKRANQARVEADAVRRRSENEVRLAYEAEVSRLRELSDGAAHSISCDNVGKSVATTTRSALNWAYVHVVLDLVRPWLVDSTVAGLLVGFARQPEARDILMVLADALEDAGCEDAALTARLRKAGEAN